MFYELLLRFCIISCVLWTTFKVYIFFIYCHGQWPRAHAAAAAKSLQSCPTLRPHRRQPTRLRRPWDSPGKNTEADCYFLLQCMKVKSESEIAQLCPTLRNPMDCSLPGSSVHGIFQARALEWGAVAFSEEYMKDFKKQVKNISFSNT